MSPYSFIPTYNTPPEVVLVIQCLYVTLQFHPCLWFDLQEIVRLVWALWCEPLRCQSGTCMAPNSYLRAERCHVTIIGFPITKLIIQPSYINNANNPILRSYIESAPCFLESPLISRSNFVPFLFAFRKMRLSCHCQCLGKYELT